MNIHKSTRLTPVQRKGVWLDFTKKKMRVADLSRKYNVSRPTIYKVLTRARRKEFVPRKSTNKRFKCLKYGLERLAKIEKRIEQSIKVQRAMNL